MIPNAPLQGVNAKPCPLGMDIDFCVGLWLNNRDKFASVTKGVRTDFKKLKPAA